MDRARYLIACDGACVVGEKLGGYGALIRNLKTGKETTTAGAVSGTTSQRMELIACVEGIRAALALETELPDLCVVSDSKYLITYALCCDWRAKKLSKEDTPNADLLRAISELLEPYTSESGPQLEVHWVRGHAGNPENEIANDLAQGAMRKLQTGIKLSQKSLPAKPYIDEDKEETLSEAIENMATQPKKKSPKYRLRKLPLTR